MPIQKTVLKLSKIVLPETEVVSYHVPASGTFFASKFTADAVFERTCSVKLIWDYGGTEEIIWSCCGSVVLDYDFELVGDGVKKIALSLSNGFSSNAALSGAVTIVEDI